MKSSIINKKLSLIVATLISMSFLFMGCGAADDMAPLPDGEPEWEDDAQFDVDEEVDFEEDDVDDETDYWYLEEDDYEYDVGTGIHGLLSRINHGDNAVYIFGSMHYGRSNWYPLHEAVEAAMRWADVFVFETDLSVAGQMAAASIMREYMMLNDGSLSEFLDEDAFIHLMEMVETYGITYEDIRHLTPWAISIMLAETAYNQVGISANHGIDSYVMAFADLNNRPIIHLNPIDHEMNLALDIPSELQRYAALGMVDLETAIREVEAMVLAYEVQEIGMIKFFARRDLIITESLDPLEEYLMDVIIIQRSMEFAREIIRLLEETEEPTNFFVTIGIGHMVGDDYGNVLNYIRNAGFEVVPMYY